MSGLPAGFDYNVISGPSSLQLEIAALDAIPEPGTLSLLLAWLGGLPLLTRWRRRQPAIGVASA